MSKTETSDDLVSFIRNAFRGVTRKEGISLHEAERISIYATDDERAEARKKDTDETWEDVSVAQMKACAPLNAMLFMDPAGLKYYLPAHMKLVLESDLTEDAVGVVLGSILSVLRIGESRGSDYFGDYSPDQVEAVLKFLNHIAEGEDGYGEWFQAKQAIQKYWSRYEHTDI